MSMMQGGGNSQLNCISPQQIQRDGDHSNINAKPSIKSKWVVFTSLTLLFRGRGHNGPPHK